MKRMISNSRLVFVRPALVIVTVAALGVAAFGQLGTSRANVPITAPSNVTLPSPLVPRLSVTSAGYATGGVALRNRQKGVIEISGVSTPVSSATLYFAYLFATTPPAAKKVTVHRITPPATLTNPANATVTGSLLATGADPCWGSAGIAIYKASVPTTVAYTNGAYQINVPSTVSSNNTGADPWAGITFPAAEGASLVLIGSGSSTVSVFDAGLAGATFLGSFSYSLGIPAAPGNQTLFDNIGADGQKGSSRTESIAEETTTINGVVITGSGSAIDTDSDWDGSSGWPLPQLWDDTGHDITAATPPGTTSLSISISSPGPGVDCLTPVANVVSEN